MTMRSRAEITALLDGFDLVEPGLVYLPLWRPDPGTSVDDPPERSPASRRSAQTQVTIGDIPVPRLRSRERRCGDHNRQRLRRHRRRRAPFEPTTIERRDLGPARRPDRHQVRRHLPLRHPHRPRRVGPSQLPDRRPATRSPASSPRSAPRSRKHAVGDRVGVGCIVDSCRECEHCLAGEEQYCLKGNVGTYGGVGRDGEPTDGGYSDAHRRRRGLRRCASPRASSSTWPRRCCAPASPSTPRCKHWNAGPGKKVAIVGLGGLGHMGVKIAHAHGRRGHRAQPVAARSRRTACGSAPTTTTRPATTTTFERRSPARST